MLILLFQGLPDQTYIKFWNNFISSHEQFHFNNNNNFQERDYTFQFQFYRHVLGKTSAFLSVNINAKNLHNIRPAKQCNYNNTELEIKSNLLEWLLNVKVFDLGIESGLFPKDVQCFFDFEIV